MASKDSPLGRAIGFSALMRLFGKLSSTGLTSTPNPRLDYEFFSEQFAKASGLSPITFEQYPPSGSGETALYNALHDAIYPQNLTLNNASD